MSRFRIDIYDNRSTPVHRDNIGPIAEGLVFTTRLPGGCGEATFRVQLPTHILPQWLDYNYDLRILDERRMPWRGRIEDYIAHRGPDGEWWDVTALGYAINLDDQFYTSQNVQNQQTSVIVTNALANAPQITASTVTATGFTIANTAAVNLIMMTMAQVIRWAEDFFNSADEQQIWYVYPDDDGTVRFTWIPRSAATHLLLARALCEVSEFGVMGRQLADRYIVNYNAGASNVTVNNTTLQGPGPNGWNVIRARHRVIPEISNSADATQAADGLLAFWSKKRMNARQITLKQAHQLPTIQTEGTGEIIVPYMVRAGQVLHFTDVNPAEGPGTESWNDHALIVGTVYNEDEQTLTITPESYDPTMDAFIARVRGVLEGRHKV